MSPSLSYLMTSHVACRREVSQSEKYMLHLIYYRLLLSCRLGEELRLRDSYDGSQRSPFSLARLTSSRKTSHNSIQHAALSHTTLAYRMMVKVQLVMSERQSPIVAVLILSQAGGDNSSDGGDWFTKHLGDKCLFSVSITNVSSNLMKGYSCERWV